VLLLMAGEEMTSAKSGKRVTRRLEHRGRCRDVPRATIVVAGAARS